MNQKAGSMIYEIASLTLAMTKKKHQRKAPLPPCHCEESCKDDEAISQNMRSPRPPKKHGGLAMTKKRHHEGLLPPCHCERPQGAKQSQKGHNA